MFNGCWHAIVEQPFRGSNFFIEKVSLELNDSHYFKQGDQMQLMKMAKKYRKMPIYGSGFFKDKFGQAI